MAWKPSQSPQFPPAYSDVLFIVLISGRTSDLESIKPGGPGHVSTIRVRLLHAAVRRRIMKLAKEKPDYYSVEQFGIPINDLDSIVSINF
jgi:hypothetical protein